MAKTGTLPLALFVTALTIGLVLSSAALIRWLATSRATRRERWQAAVRRLRQRPLESRDAVVLLLLLAVSQTSAIIQSVARRPAATGVPPGFWPLLLPPLTLDALLLAAILLPLRLRGVAWPRAFGWPRRRAAQRLGALAGLRFGCGVILPLCLIAAACTLLYRQAFGEAPPQPVIDLLGDPRLSRASAVGIAFLAVCVAPVVEETAFRGLLLPLLLRGGPPWRALLTLALLFAALHLHAAALLPLMAVSLAFSLGYLATGNLATPIIMHALFNSATLLGFYLFGV